MEITNEEILLRYAFPEAFPEDQSEIPTSVFQDPNLSCDWKRYVTDPQKSPHINAGRSVIIYITVCDDIKRPKNPRGIDVPSCFQEVLHDPLTIDDEFGPNEAHSLIRGKKKQLVVEAIRRNSTWSK